MSYLQRGTDNWITLDSPKVPKSIYKDFLDAGIGSVSKCSVYYHTVSLRAESPQIKCSICNVSYRHWTRNCPGFYIIWGGTRNKNFGRYLSAGDIDFVGDRWLLNPDWLYIHPEAGE